MIISRTPLRISFVGGGSDFKSFYQRGYGAVVSTAINKFVYVVVNRRSDNLIRVSYSKTEIVDNASKIENDIVRACLNFLGITNGIEIVFVGDVPTEKGGTGLATSSAFTVGLLNSLYAYKGQIVDAAKLAKDACEIEIEILGRPIGKQDQYAVAYGGFNYIKFNADENVEVRPVSISEEEKNSLNNKLLMLNTGFITKSSVVLSEQKSKISENHSALSGVVELAYNLNNNLMLGKYDVLGNFLHKNWLFKKQFASKITNSDIDNYYQIAIRAGAAGGKILGSGGGGFLLFYCENDEIKNKVRKSLSNLSEMTFRFEPKGSKIIYYAE